MFYDFWLSGYTQVNNFMILFLLFLYAKWAVKWNYKIKTSIFYENKHYVTIIYYIASTEVFLIYNKYFYRKILYGGYLTSSCVIIVLEAATEDTGNRMHQGLSYYPLVIKVLHNKTMMFRKIFINNFSFKIKQYELDFRGY